MKLPILKYTFCLVQRTSLSCYGSQRRDSQMSKSHCQHINDLSHIVFALIPLVMMIRLLEHFLSTSSRFLEKEDL